MKNTGKPTEARFEQSITALGKAGYFYRIKDAADIRGLTGKIGHADATPSDYVCTVLGRNFYAEVKSTQDEYRFAFSLLKKGQNSHGARIVSAGGLYFVVVHRLQTDTWYMVPMATVQDHEHQTGKRSMSWFEMETFACSMLSTPSGNRIVWS